MAKKAIQIEGNSVVVYYTELINGEKIEKRKPFSNDGYGRAKANIFESGMNALGRFNTYQKVEQSNFAMHLVG